MPRKVFTAGEVLAAADVNEFLQDQAVMTFAGTAARGSAIPTPTEGMLTYLADSDSFEFFDGTSFVPMASDPPLLEYLVIGGGGGGAKTGNSQGGGGGGAGGYRTNVSGQLSGGSVTAELALPFQLNTAYPITVGAGGASVTVGDTAGNRGSRSVLCAITSQGGGGGRSLNRDNATGGSGGGGNQIINTRGLGIVSEGTDGGLGPLTTGINAGGGGGGAGVAGPIGATTNNGTAGGAGLSSNITGSGVTRAGGGGGGGQTTGGAGGAGGGGAGGGGAGVAGTVNTGGGGGGASSGNSGAGGSGVVIFSVVTGTTVTFSGGVTETNSTVSGRQVYVVTATSTTSETVTFS
jgi:hypothetical protein